MRGFSIDILCYLLKVSTELKFKTNPILNLTMLKLCQNKKTVEYYYTCIWPNKQEFLPTI